MSEGISCSDRALAALWAVRKGEPPSHEEVRALGEQCPAEFFRIVVESLSDSFEPAETLAYEQLMRAWIPEAPQVRPVIPGRVDTVYVLSRVTLGADIKITSVILSAMKDRFPDAGIVLVGNRKSAELFAGDSRIRHLQADYPRSGSVTARLAFADDLRRRLDTGHRIVLDPDTRLTQLGLIPLCEPEHYFHFPSRSAGGESGQNLSALTSAWLESIFGIAGEAWLAPPAAPVLLESPAVTVSLGVGGNEEKRIPGGFEAQLIRALAGRFRTIWIDRGAGGEEADRVTAAVESSGAQDRVRFWEGSFAGFASLIANGDLYVGYDSAGQHAAAAARVRLITIFAGAVNDRFRARWSPSGPGPIAIIDAAGLAPQALLERFLSELALTAVLEGKLLL